MTIHNKINKQDLVTSGRLISSIFVCIVLLSVCRHEVPIEKVAYVDSLITVILELQEKISSPAVQRMSQIGESIVSDLKLVSDSIDFEFNQERMNKILSDYISLYKDFSNCMAACSKYHEEIFLVENNLQTIRGEMFRKNYHAQKTDSRIADEEELLDDLKLRIDSNLFGINKNVERFYMLKPSVDTLIQRIRESYLRKL